MVRAILLHENGTLINIALAAAERNLLSVIECELAVAQWMVHLHRQLCIRPFDSAQVATVLLRNRRHARPFRVVVGHLHLLDRRQIQHPDLEMTRGQVVGLDVIFDVFRKACEEELIIGRSRANGAIQLRLHSDRLPGFTPRALVVRKKLDPSRFQTNHLRGHQLIAVTPHGNVARGNSNVVKRYSLGPSPEQRRPIAEITGTCGNQPGKYSQAREARTR